MTSSYRSIPSVEKLLSDDRIKGLMERYARDPVVDLMRERLDEVREEIARGGEPPSFDELADGVVTRASSLWRAWPTPLINATGVVIHTNLGRAPLSPEATEAALNVARGYSDLELELEDGRRGSRQAHIAPLLRQLTGAQSALVVNNNASAMLLALQAIAQGREVIVSRGEAVEIGGGFRIPDVLRQSGATLVEVGSTNRTYGSDYEEAITAETAILLKVHTSNFRVVGFTHEASVEELAALGARHGIPVLHDLGSGCLLETAAFGLAHEPMPQESISAGADLALFSGDKLLGGPQAGIVVGREDLVARLARHPLARALRIDKMGLASLSATLLHYLKDEALERVPVWRMLATTLEELEARANDWQRRIGGKGQVIRGLSTIGGGSLPGETLSTWLLALQADTIAEGAQGLAARLRWADPPIVARIEDDRLVLDPRTVLPGEEDALFSGLRAALEA